MSDMTRDRDMELCELDAALENATVLAEEYAGYDEYAARRRIARRVVADRARQTKACAGAPRRCPDRGPRCRPIAWCSTPPAMYGPRGAWRT